MGYDITYHMIRREEIQHFYFDILANPELLPVRLQELDGMSGYENLMKNHALKTEPDKFFNATHGYYIGSLAGRLHKYWYVRGAAFTFLASEDEHFVDYALEISDWVPTPWCEMQSEDFFVLNYMSGAYLPHEKLAQLRDDLTNNEDHRNAVEETYSHDRLPVFLEALDHAIEHGFDILEVTDLVMPHPYDDDATNFNTDPDNCEGSGLRLFREAATAQIAAVNKPTDDADIPPADCPIEQLPRPGQVYLVPLQNGKFGVVRVLALKNQALVCAAPWFGERAGASLDAEELRSPLVMTHPPHEQLAAHWVGQPVPADFILLGEHELGEQETDFRRRTMEPKTWDWFREQLFEEYRWQHERERIVEADRQKLLAAIEANDAEALQEFQQPHTCLVIDMLEQEPEDFPDYFEDAIPGLSCDMDEDDEFKYTFVFNGRTLSTEPREGSEDDKEEPLADYLERVVDELNGILEPDYHLRRFAEHRGMAGVTALAMPRDWWLKLAAQHPDSLDLFVSEP